MQTLVAECPARFHGWWVQWGWYGGMWQKVWLVTEGIEHAGVCRRLCCILQNRDCRPWSTGLWFLKRVLRGPGLTRKFVLSVFAEVNSRFGTTLEFVLNLCQFFDQFLWFIWHYCEDSCTYLRSCQRPNAWLACTFQTLLYSHWEGIRPLDSFPHL